MKMKWVMASTFTQLFGHSGHHDHATRHNRRRFKETAAAAPNKEDYPYGFQMPLHYPKFSKSDYENMDETRLDLLLKEYGLSFDGTLDDKRAFAMGSFLWPHQL